MTKPKAINRKKLVAFVLHIFKIYYIPIAHPGSRYFYLKEASPRPRKKKPQTLQELYAAKEETENELRKAKQKEKILQNQISKLTRNARTHRLCTRAGMLESFLPNPELLTDDEVMTVLKIAFHQPAMKSVLEKLAAESEARKTLTE